MHRFNEPTRTCGGGRFVVDIPAAMTFAGGYSIRTCRIEEFVWDNPVDQNEVIAAWDELIGKIRTITPPKGKDTAIIEIRDFSQEDFICKSILYHKEPLDPDYGYLILLVKKGTVGLWIQTDGKLAAKDIIYDVGTEVARAYRAPERRFDRAEVIDGRDAFYLRYGAVDLPFEYKESVDIVFRKHPLDKQLVLTINTRVVDKVNPVGMLEGLAAALASNIAPGVEVEKIQTRKRRVAGLAGEEMILKGTERGKTMLNFQWYYPGQVNDSTHPRMLLVMDANDGAVEDKIDLWDAILDSLRPAGR